MIPSEEIRQRGLDNMLADYIVNQFGDVNIGGIVRERTDDNLVSLTKYKIIGYDKFNQLFTLKTLDR